MSFTGFNMKNIFKAHDKAGHHIGCVVGIHDFNKRRICRKCKFVESKPKSEKLK